MSAPHPLLPPMPSASAASSSASFSKQFFVASPAEPHMFHPHDTGSIVMRTTMLGAGAGFAVSCFQNALQKHDKGAMGVFTRTGGSIAYFTGVAFAFSSAQAIAANVRETDDALNGAIGGCAAGFVAGIYGRSLPAAFGGCAFMGTLIGTFNAAGGSFAGKDTAPTTGVEREEARKSWFKQKKPLLDETPAGQPA
ncbi:hypothetical protein DB88DRAFT_474745 [Papiliotrema laurentii]|uniref:NADH dehydrogenase [ubiquinone] 1 alpha subcomplex subunit 11 n=1 Tax=Papiliotrema laurentii TaxID=5418 RepID=A0AAD9FN04_PAPLA|nr:hypothetical protein DB88DRAFT_474745 [Papiliotrema laurentii]